MSSASSTLTTVLLAGATLLCSIAGPRLGSPDPAIMMTVMFSSLLSSIAGFAFSAICGGILFHLWDDHVRIVQLMIACSIASQTAMVISLRRAIAWRELLPTLAGGLCGVPVGGWVLQRLDHARFGQAIGGVLLVYACFVALGQNRPRLGGPRWADGLVGMAGGITGASAALPSLPLTVWCQLQGRDKVAMRAAVQPFILVMQVASLGWMGLADPSRGGFVAAPDLLCIPAALFGTHVGLGCCRGLSERQFALAVATLLVVCGLSFVL